MTRREATLALISELVLAGVVVLMIVVAICQAGCRPYAAAWRTLDAVQGARRLTAEQLADVAKRKHDSCANAHGVKTAKYAECISRHKQALDMWRQIVRPAIITAVQITATAITIAERAKKKVEWTDLLKPAICALTRGLRSFGDLLPKRAQPILDLLPMLEGVTCE